MKIEKHLKLWFSTLVISVLSALSSQASPGIPRGLLLVYEENSGIKFAVPVSYDRVRHSPSSVTVYDSYGRRTDVRKDLVILQLDLVAPFSEIISENDKKNLKEERESLQEMLSLYPNTGAVIHPILKQYYTAEMMLKSNYVRHKAKWIPRDKYEQSLRATNTNRTTATFTDRLGNTYHEARFLKYYKDFALLSHSKGLKRIPYHDLNLSKK